jgi:rare lipoprotein A
MRRALGVRELRRSHAALGALIVGIPASAGILATAGRALADTVAAQPAPSGELATHVHSRRIAFGHDVVVEGAAPASESGHEVQLQFAPAHSSTWSTLRSTTVPSSGRFRLAAPLKRSGAVRVVEPSPGSSGAGTTTASAASSSTQNVAVAAKLRVPSQAINDLGGHPVDIRGRLLPGVSGRKVKLESRSGRGWHVVATARTGSAGRFDLHYTPPGTGREQLRVRFGGDVANASTGAHAGTVAVFEQTVASWYNDAGSTACGFHAYYGVANRSLPCGTRVTFVNGGRTVTATVDDRGPFVGGRDWDLNQNTAAALGFGGVGSLWYSL